MSRKKVTARLACTAFLLGMGIGCSEGPCPPPAPKEAVLTEIESHFTALRGSLESAVGVSKGSVERAVSDSVDWELAKNALKRTFAGSEHANVQRWAWSESLLFVGVWSSFDQCGTESRWFAGYVYAPATPTWGLPDKAKYVHIEGPWYVAYWMNHVYAY